MSFDTDSLISSVSKRAVLWDVSNKYFKDRKISSRAWKEVCSELKTKDGALVKKRWKTLKDYYRTEVKKINKSGSSGSPKKKSVWPYFQQMDFIKNTLGVNRSCRILQNDFTIAVNNSIMDSSNAIEEKNIFSVMETEEQQSIDNAMTNDIENTTTTSKQAGKNKNLKKNIDFRDIYIENEKKKLALLEEASKEDDDVLFLHSLLPDIKSLSRTEKLKLRMDMQRLVYDAVLKQSSNLVPYESSYDTHSLTNYSSPDNSPDRIKCE